jgi:hypothetical protein
VRFDREPVRGERCTDADDYSAIRRRQHGRLRHHHSGQPRHECAVRRRSGIWSPGQQIVSIPAETPAGASLGNVQVLSATSVPQSGAGDPILQLYSTRAATTRIDPIRYRILTVEFGIPNAARNVNNGSIARIAWRVAGGTDSVSDDIVFNSRVGVNVMDKITVDMADRAVLPIEEGSQAGAWELQRPRHRPAPLRPARIQRRRELLRQAREAGRPRAVPFRLLAHFDGLERRQRTVLFY